MKDCGHSVDISTPSHATSYPCESCVLARRANRMALTPSMYPSTCPTSYTILPPGEALCMAMEDLEYHEAKVREKKADIRVLMDCATNA
jgi:hypothetical protein